MKKIHKEEIFHCSHPILQELFDEHSIFFDIETTGFAPTHSCIYLIGCSFRKGNTLHVNQFFAESPSEEIQILIEFLNLVKNFKTLISFNGINFDLPFIQAKCNQYELSTHFEDYSHLDLFKSVSQLKFLLKLENYKQKSIESFLELKRDDRFSGGDLINVYKDYTVHPNEEGLSLLLLHNYEDVVRMYELLPVLSYLEFFSGSYQIIKTEQEKYISYSKEEKTEFIITMQCNSPVPKQVSCKKGEFYLTLNKDIAKLRVPVIEDELRFFYEDYKNYYYLPNEDMAIHKSVASFVEKEYRERARANNCYTRKRSTFLPQFENIINPEFKREQKDKISYFELNDAFCSSDDFLKQYVAHILRYLTQK